MCKGNADGFVEDGGALGLIKMLGESLIWIAITVRRTSEHDLLFRTVVERQQQLRPDCGTINAANYTTIIMK